MNKNVKLTKVITTAATNKPGKYRITLECGHTVILHIVHNGGLPPMINSYHCTICNPTR